MLALLDPRPDRSSRIRNAVENREVEVDNVPSGEDVRIELGDPLHDGVEQFFFGAVGDRFRRARGAGWGQKMHFLDVVARQGDRQESLRSGVGLDV